MVVVAYVFKLATKRGLFLDNLVECGLMLWQRHTRNWGPHRAVLVIRHFVDIVEEGAQRVEVFLRRRVVLVIVTNSAAYRQTQIHRAERLRPVARDVYLQFFRD